MAENIITITEEGYKKLTEELEYLRTTKRNEVRESVKVARSFGDLSENAEYDAARTEQAQVEAQIAELEDKLSRMKVVSENDITTDRVNVGAKVKIHNLNFDDIIEYYLVGSTEADPFQNKISDSSPIGKAIIGAKVGDNVTVRLPKGDIQIVILDISK
ncbi:MAG: transcription elongation factor GreA [Clostridia bacterium]|nr:transcription elongation factor GreA [Clostridia bacterium]